MAFDFDDIPRYTAVAAVVFGVTAIIAENKIPKNAIDDALGGPGSCTATSGDQKATSTHSLASACFNLLNNTTGPITVEFDRADGRGSFVLLRNGLNSPTKIVLPAPAPAR